jgi:hypothetical protein
MMFKAILLAAGAASVAMLAPTVASAHSQLSITIGSGYGYNNPYYAQNGYDEHELQHEQLDARHDDIHDQLDEEHAQAHEEGLTPWEHARLHRQLARQHARADRQLEWQHQRQHQIDEWRQQYYNGYGY